MLPEVLYDYLLFGHFDCKRKLEGQTHISKKTTTFIKKRKFAFAAVIVVILKGDILYAQFTVAG